MKATDVEPNRTSENINNIMRGLTFLGILWLVNTANTNTTSLATLAVEVGYIKKEQRKQDAMITKHINDVFSRKEGERLEARVNSIDEKFVYHKENYKHERK